MSHDHHDSPMTHGEAAVTIIQMLGLLLILAVFVPFARGVKWIIRKLAERPIPTARAKPSPIRRAAQRLMR